MTAVEGAARPTTTPTPASTVVQVENLVKTFDNGRVRALDDVTFSVPEGQLCVIIGLSGSGKSTLLRHLNGLHDPTSGSVTVLGQRVDELKGAELRSLRTQVGFVFQQFNIVGRLSCLENVLSGALGRLRGPRMGVPTYPKSLRQEALTQLERVGLGDRAFQRTDTLSGGQQQRVAIARALVTQPPLLLADEPTGNLDTATSRDLMALFTRIRRESRLTIVMVTHEPDIAAYAERVLYFVDGRVRQDGPPQQVLA